MKYTQIKVEKNKMKPKFKIWIVIPAYNEAENIGKVFKDLHKHGYKNIIVVDDFSTDSTRHVLSRIRAKNVLFHKENKGQGAALVTGITEAIYKNSDIIVTFDADGQHCAQDIEALVKPIIDGKVDIVFGTRFQNSKVSFDRKILLKVGTKICNLMYGMHLTDTHNGLRAMNRKAALKIKITEPRMTHASEFIEQTAIQKLRYSEVPVTIKYTKKSKKDGQNNTNAIAILSKMMAKKCLKK